MTRLHNVVKRISATRKYLNILERYLPYSAQEIEQNIDLRGSVERYLYLAIQSAIDAGECYLALHGTRKPSSLSEVFYILQEDSIIDIDLQETMIAATGFRNVIPQCHFTRL